MEPIESPDTSRCFLGIDGGGSKTVAVIVDADGNLLGQARAGSANHHAVGLTSAVANIHRAGRDAAERAGCSLPVSAGWIGTAGLDSSSDYDLLVSHLYPLAARIRLTNDAELVLSVLDHAVGVALIAGTGAIAFGRDHTGNWK